MENHKKCFICGNYFRIDFLKRGVCLICKKGYRFDKLFITKDGRCEIIKNIDINNGKSRKCDF